MDDTENCLKYLNLLLEKPTKELRLYQAMQYQLENKQTSAGDLYLEILQINENTLIANYGLHKIYTHNNNIDELKNILNTLGKIFYNNENYPYAIKFFNKYKKLFPEDTSPYSYLGIVYESTKQYDKAIKELEKAVKIDPDDAKLNFYLGVLYEKKKEYEKAIKQLEKVIKLDNKHLHAYIRLSYIYNYQEQNKDSINILKKALSIIPQEPDLYFLLGMNYTKEKKYNEAIKAYKKGLSFDNSDQLLNFNLAVTYDKNNDKESAIIQLKKCLELDKEDPEVNNYLAYLYSELGTNLEDAKIYVQISLNTDNENYAYLDTAGWIYYKMSDFEKAKSYLIKAEESMVKEKKYDPVIYEHLIELYTKLNNQKMVEYYDKKIKIK